MYDYLKDKSHGHYLMYIGWNTLLTVQLIVPFVTSATHSETL